MSGAMSDAEDELNAEPDDSEYEEEDEYEEEGDDDEDDDASLLSWLRSDWRSRRHHVDQNQLAFSFMDESAPSNVNLLDEAHHYSVESVQEATNEGQEFAADEGNLKQLPLALPSRTRRGQGSVKAASRLLKAHGDEIDDYLESQAIDQEAKPKPWRSRMIRETLAILRLALTQAVQEIVKHAVGILFKASSH